MSQSPTTAAKPAPPPPPGPGGPGGPGEPGDPGDEAQQRYTQAWLALGDQVLRGRSFSGRERNHAFLNLGNARFADASAAVGFDLPEDGRALAAGDLDDDGDLDVVVSHRSAPRLRIYSNRAPSGHVLGLHLVNASAGKAASEGGGNRDAIGAQVRVMAAAADGSARGPFVAAISAGDGFLAQASTALRIGLGDAVKVTSLDVLWPGGRKESFDTKAIEIDAAYFVHAGKRQPTLRKRWPRATAQVVTPLAASTPPPAWQAGAIGPQRVFFSARIAAPPVRFTGGDNKAQALSTQPGRPVLVVLWASWCKPCLEELRELGRRSEALKAANIEVVALSVEGLPGGERPRPETVAAQLQGLGFRGVGGVAPAPMIARYELALQLLTMVRRPLPLPTSLLIDAEGDLAAAYRGRLDVDRMVADAAVGADITARRAAAVVAVRHGPLPVGHWIYPVVDIDLPATTMHFVEAKMPDVAMNILEARIRKEPSNGGHHNDLGVLFAQMGEMEPATQAFAKAVELSPNDERARRNLEYATRQLKEGPPPGTAHQGGANQGAANQGAAPQASAPVGQRPVGQPPAGQTAPRPSAPSGAFGNLSP